MIHRHSSPGEGLAPWQIQPVWLNGTTPRHVIPSAVEESSQVADFTLRWYFLLRGGFLHSADAQGLNDRRFWFGCYKCKRTTIPALRPGGGRLPPLQWGYHVLGCTIQPHRLYIQRGGRLVAAPTIYLELPLFQRVYYGLTSVKCQKCGMCDIKAIWLNGITQHIRSQKSP